VSGLTVATGQEDAGSTTALAGSFASNAAAAVVVETASSVTDAAAATEADDVDVHS